MAAGFVAKTENLPQIEQRLTELLWQQFDKSSLNPQLAIDAEVGLGEMDWNVYSFICQLEPFGMGNPKPVFVTRGVRVAGFKVVGGDGKHLKLTVSGENGDTSIAMDGIAFGLGYLADTLEIGSRVDVAYQLDENVWQNRRSLQLMVKDLRMSKKESDPAGL